jgi:hypothetical protein
MSDAFDHLTAALAARCVFAFAIAALTEWFPVFPNQQFIAIVTLGTLMMMSAVWIAVADKRHLISGLWSMEMLLFFDVACAREFQLNWQRPQ